jgi:hypothetical protein
MAGVGLEPGSIEETEFFSPLEIPLHHSCYEFPTKSATISTIHLTFLFLQSYFTPSQFSFTTRTQYFSAPTDPHNGENLRPSFKTITPRKFFFPAKTPIFFHDLAPYEIRILFEKKLFY